MKNYKNLADLIFPKKNVEANQTYEELIQSFINEEIKREELLILELTQEPFRLFKTNRLCCVICLS